MLSRPGSALLGTSSTGQRRPSSVRRSHSVRGSASSEDAAATLPAPPPPLATSPSVFGRAPVPTTSPTTPVRGLRHSLTMASLIRPVEGASSRELLEQVISHVSLPAPQLAAIARSMASSMAAGLASCEGDGPLLMLPTATDSLPDGHERGEYFALDFGGGPSLRLLFVRFSDDRRHETSALDVEEVAVPSRLRAAHADELFDFLAERALDFVRRVGWDAAERGPPVFGFCFSFPVDQSAHPSEPARGTLLRWAKGYSWEGGVGCEPSACLEAAARRVAAKERAAAAAAGEGGGGEETSLGGIGDPLPPPLVVAALANDTVATLAAARYADGGDAAMSLVLHRGTNAAYVESLANVAKQCDAEALKARGWAPRSPEVVVDVEWPAFDDALLPALPDDAGIRGSARVFESLTAPMCLGEAARRLLVRLGDAGGWFFKSSGEEHGNGGGGGGKTKVPPLWSEPDALEAVAVARIAADGSTDARFAAEELAAAFVKPGDSSPAAAAARANFLRFLHNNRDARVQCRDACSALLRRSARLTAAGLAGVLLHMEETTAGASSPSSAPCSPLPAAASSPALPSQQRRTIVAVEGVMLRRGGFFVDELRRALAETLEASFASSSSSSSTAKPPLPLVSLTVPDGGSALGVAALAAAAHNAARAMGHQELGQATTEGEFLRFPPRKAAK